MSDVTSLQHRSEADCSVVGTEAGLGEDLVGGGEAWMVRWKDLGAGGFYDGLLKNVFPQCSASRRASSKIT